MASKTPSLFWRLTTAISLVLLLGAGTLAYAAYNYAHTAADDAYDRLLLGAASQIGETIRVEDEAITTDIPVSAFETLSVSKQERVYYRVIGPDGASLTGYDDLQVPQALSEAGFQPAGLGCNICGLPRARCRHLALCLGSRGNRMDHNSRGPDARCPHRIGA